jgi:gluconate 2-dehydrogenase gamma chain
VIVLTRREVLFGLAGIGIFGGCRGAGREKDQGTGAFANSEISQVLVFTPAQQPTVDAVVETILPGAEDAGVPDYMAYWLAQKPFESTRRYLLRGLREIDKRAARQFKQPFAGCKRQEREAVLKPFAEGKVNAKQLNGAIFYQQLVELTLEGYLSDPKYGGNRKRVGWRFIGIPDGLRSCWWNPNGVAEVLGYD